MCKFCFLDFYIEKRYPVNFFNSISLKNMMLVQANINLFSIIVKCYPVYVFNIKIPRAEVVTVLCLLAGDVRARAGARGRPHATPQPHRSSAWT